MTSAKKNKIRLSLFVSFSLYTILSFVISAPHLSDFSSTIDAILYALSSYRSTAEMSSEDASAAPKRQRGACTAQPQREKTLYHNVAECQAESKNGSGTGQPEREKILSQGDRIVKPHKNVHKLHAAACPIRIFSRKICAHIKGVNYHGNNQTHL